jgi:RNA polymerase sigma-70 factor (ECF subfamily)
LRIVVVIRLNIARTVCVEQARANTLLQASIFTARGAGRTLLNPLRRHTLETVPSDASFSDIELLRRIAAGDVEALGSLYDRHAAALMGVAMRILRDRALAEDLIHDVFVNLHERAARYDASRGSVLTWLASATRNLGIDRLRQLIRQRRVCDAIANEVDPVVRNPDAPFTDGDKIVSALTLLPPDQLLVIEALYFGGLSFSEIAEREQTPVGTVKSRAARAMATLRDALAEKSHGSTSAPQTYTPRDPKGVS